MGSALKDTERPNVSSRAQIRIGWTGCFVKIPRQIDPLWVVRKAAGLVTKGAYLTHH